MSVVPASMRQKAAPVVEIEGVGKAEEYGVVTKEGEEVAIPGYDHGVEEAEKRNQSENASTCFPGGTPDGDRLMIDLGIWTQLALAYAIHKSFIFVRVPLTAAITPRVVKTLRGWGWNIGKRRPKGPKDITKD